MPASALVVDTVSFNGKTRLDTIGHPSAPGTHDFCGVVQIFEARVHAR